VTVAPEASTAVAESEDVAVALRDSLLDRLRAQREYALPFYAWYSGQQPKPAVQARYRQAYELLLDMSTRGWARLVIEAISERLEIQGVLSGAGDEQVEQDAWRILQANHIDADQRLVHREVLIAGRGYVGVSDLAGEPRLTPESMLQVTHAAAPGDPRRIVAALKVFVDDLAGETRAELYTPASVWVWQADVPHQGAGLRYTVDEWNGAQALRADNELGVVPFVPFENRPLILVPGRSELHELTPIFRSIDFMIMNLLLATETAAFRQKWVTGLEVPKDPATGKDVEPFKVALDRLFVGTSPDIRFGNFDDSDLSQYIKVIDSFVAELAAISRVPAHYLLSQTLANPPSAESLVAGESGLVSKVQDRQAQFGESWERVTRIALAIAGAEPEALELQVLWRDPAQRSPAQTADAAVKLQAIGVPTEALWEYVGYTPQQVDRMRSQAAEQAFLSAAAPAAPTGTPATSGASA
jgi:hypothetical protein